MELTRAKLSDCHSIAFDATIVEVDEPLGYYLEWIETAVIVCVPVIIYYLTNPGDTTLLTDTEAVTWDTTLLTDTEVVTLDNRVNRIEIDTVRCNALDTCPACIAAVVEKFR